MLYDTCIHKGNVVIIEQKQSHDWRKQEITCYVDNEFVHIESTDH